MKKNLKLLLGATAGYLVLTHVARPANVRGNDPGFDWQGKHIAGGQGSAITNLGSKIKTDYVLVAASMKNFALDKWGAFGPHVPKLTMEYALLCVDYWYKEAGRILGRSSGAFGAEDPLRPLPDYGPGVTNVKGTRLVGGTGLVNDASFYEIVKGYRRFVDLLPRMIRSAAIINLKLFGSTTIAGQPANYALSTEFAQPFWEAIVSAGIAFDVGKATPTEDTVWTAGWKAAKDAVKGAPGKAIEFAAKGTWWGLKTALSNPLFAALAVGAGYVYWRRRQ